MVIFNISPCATHNNYQLFASFLSFNQLILAIELLKYMFIKPAMIIKDRRSIIAVVLPHTRLDYQRVPDDSGGGGGGGGVS